MAKKNKNISEKKQKQERKRKQRCLAPIIIAVSAVVVVAVAALVLIQTIGHESQDSVKFAKEYTEVGEDNVFTYRTGEEIVNILENGTGVVFLGFPECPWCQSYAKYLNETAKKIGIEKIYYYNIEDARKNNTEDYQKIVNILGDLLQYNDEGKHYVYVPDVAFVINGEIIGNDYETSKDTGGHDNPEDYWDNQKVFRLKSRLMNYMRRVKDADGCGKICN